MASSTTPPPPPTSSSSLLPNKNNNNNHQQQQQAAVVHLLDLAAAAVACTVTASQHIRRLETTVVAAQQQPQQNKNAAANANAAAAVRLKADGSFVTDADLLAQTVIVQAIQRINPNIVIVGEEEDEQESLAAASADDDDNAAERMAQQHLDKKVWLLQQQQQQNDEMLWRRTRKELEMLYRQRNQKPASSVLPTSSVSSASAASTTTTQPFMKMPLAQGPPEPLPDYDTNNNNNDDNDDASLVVDCNRVSVIVDPLDGTKSYTKGETDAVSILICITLDHEPYFGVVGKPFGYTGLTNILESTCACVYGGPLLQHVYCAGQAQPLKKPALAAQPRAVISKSRSAGVVHDFCVHLGNTTGLLHPEPLMVNGAGEKSLRLILPRHGEALWFFPKGGTSRWDVAAPDALLRAMGGKLTDKYGNLLDYNKKREEAENVDGIVACIDAELHAKCIALFQQDDWLERS